jgi:large subunit ribosomal protein L30
MANAYLVVRIKGQADCPYWATHTMMLLQLDKKYRATILPAKENTLGMLRKVQHYLSWIELDASLAKELIDKKARKSGYQKITPEDLKTLGFASTDELATALAEGKATLSKLKPLKPWFALAPPVHGFKRSTKKLYGQKGVLGANKELDTIVRRMGI